VRARKDLLDLAQQAVARLALPVENRKASPPEIAALRTELNQFCTGQSEGQSFFTLGELPAT
jgi:hypothetical protein